MPYRAPIGLAILLALLAPAAVGQDAALPSPTRVTAPGHAGAYADVYPDVTPTEAGRIEAALGLARLPPPGSTPFTTLDVGVGPEADFLQDVAFTPSRDRVLTANARSNNLAVLDAATGETLAVVPVGLRPVAVAATDDVAVVPCYDGFEVYLVDLDTYEVRAVVPAVPFPAGVRILPGGTRALVASVLGGGARIIDLATGDVAVSIPTFPYEGLELTITFPALRPYYRYQPIVPSVTGDTLFATTRQPSNAVALFDAHSGAALGTIPTTVRPRAFALSADGRTLVVGELLEARAVQAVDIATGAVGPLRTLPGGLSSLVSSFAVNADGSEIVVGLRQPGGVNPTAARIPLDGSAPTLIPTRSFEFGATASPDGRLALGLGVDGAGVYDFATGELRVLTPGRWYVGGGFSPLEARWGGIPINHPGEVVSLFDATEAPAHLGDVLPGGPVEGDSPAAIALSPDGEEALVANIYTSAVTRVDLAAKAVTAVVPLDNVSPGRITALWDELVILSGTDSTGADLTTVLADLGTGAEVARGAYMRGFARGVEPTVFGWAQDHSLVRLRATASALDVVSVSQDSLVARWAASRDGRLLAVADTTRDRVLFYSGATGALLDAFALPDPTRLAVSPDGQWAFAASEADALIRRYRFDGAAVVEDGAVACGCGEPSLLATNGAVLAVSSPPLVYRFDAATGAALGTVPIPYGPLSSLALTEAGGVVALVNDPYLIFLDGLAYGLENRPTDFAFAAERGLALAIDKSNDALIIGDVQLVGAGDGPEASPLALRVSPNPARGAVHVGYSWSGPPAEARLAVYDLLGRLVYREEAPPQGPGRHTLTLDAEATSALPSGTYVVRLTVGEETAQARVTVVR